MLTDEEKQAIIDRYHTDKNYDLWDAFDAIERAVLKKLGEQEPAWYKELGTMEIEHPSRYRKRVDIGSINGLDYGSLYAHPLQAQAVPEGWQLVPIEPSQHQLHEAYDNHLMEPFSRQSTGHEVAKRIYKTMLSAAIKP